MAMTFTPDQSGDSALAVAIASGWWLVSGVLTFSGSYPAGGETLNLDRYFGSGGSVRRVVALGDVAGLSAVFDKTNKKLKLMGLNPAAATLDVAPAELPAAAYDADITAAGGHDMTFLVKYG